MKRIKSIGHCMLLPLSLVLSPVVVAEETVPVNEAAELLDASLSQWEAFIGTPHSTVAGLREGTPMSEDGMKGVALGLNNDLKNVFSTFTEDGKVVLKVSGEIYDGLTTKGDFSN